MLDYASIRRRNRTRKQNLFHRKILKLIFKRQAHTHTLTFELIQKETRHTDPLIPIANKKTNILSIHTDRE